MSNKTIDDFSAVVTPAATDTVVVTQSAVTKKETLAQIDTLLSATSKTLTNKTLTSPVINTGVSGTAIDTDGTLAANSDTLLASQKAVKTYAQLKDTFLTSLAALGTAANKLLLSSGVDTAAELELTANTFPARASAGGITAKAVTDFALSVLDDANAAAARTTLELAYASQAEMEAPASTTLVPSPITLKYHPGVAKCWCKFNSAGAVAASHNITDITDNGTGDWTINIGTDFSSVNWAYSLNCESIQAAGTLAENIQVVAGGQAAGTLRVTCMNTSAISTEIDATAMSFIGFGDQ